ncbi:hypothetical protein FOA52_002249 [Chlamydomonas sp. UWO 241]|nr:hypothetical protein FOA52_002249 [Chlamydomonas sp. UWO 241]
MYGMDGMDGMDGRRISIHICWVPLTEDPIEQNPLRNGLLLCDLASALCPRQALLARGAVSLVPRDLRASRTNTLLALQQLGLLSQLDAAAMEDAAAGGVVDASGTGMGCRSYAQRHTSVQLRNGLGLVWEAERMLQGKADAVWALLNHVRVTCDRRHEPSPRERCRSVSPHARTFPSGAAPSPAVAAVWAAVSEAAYAPKLSATATLHASATTATTPRPGGKAAAALPGGSGTARLAAAGTAGMAAAGTPREGGSSQASRASNVAAAAAGAAVPAAAGTPPGGGSSRASRANNVAAAAAAAARFSSPPPSAQGGGGGGSAHTTHTTSAAQQQQQQPRGRPSLPPASASASLVWPPPPRSSSPELLPLRRQSPSPRECDELLEPRPDWPVPVLPYSEAEVLQLEASLLRWLCEMGAITTEQAAEGFSSLLPRLSDGTVIVWLVERVFGLSLRGVHRRPMGVPSAARANWLHSIEAMREAPGSSNASMARRFLVFEEALVHVDSGAVLGMLEDLQRYDNGLPSAGSVLMPGPKGALPPRPYLPYRAALRDVFGAGKGTSNGALPKRGGRGTGGATTSVSPGGGEGAGGDVFGAGKGASNGASHKHGGGGATTSASPGGGGKAGAERARSARSTPRGKRDCSSGSAGVSGFETPPPRTQRAAVERAVGTESAAAAAAAGHRHGAAFEAAAFAATARPAGAPRDRPARASAPASSASSTGRLEAYIAAAQSAPRSPAPSTWHATGSLLSALPHLRLVRHAGAGAGAGTSGGVGGCSAGVRAGAGTPGAWGGGGAGGASVGAVRAGAGAWGRGGGGGARSGEATPLVNVVQYSPL